MNPTNNRFVFITGATAGFGEACAELYAQKGYQLILTGRRNERLQSLKNKLENNFKIIAHTLCFDVRDSEATKDAITSLDSDVQNNIEIVINNAGLAVGKGPIDTGILDDWNRMIDTNIKGVLHVSQSLIPILKKNKSGHIVNIGSIAGKEVYPGGNVYCATKHAVDALSKAMRIDLVKDGIRVTQIAPGAIETEFSIVRFKGDEDKANSIYKGYEPLVPEDVADVVYYATTLPKHMNINDLVLMPTAQASATVFNKNS